MWPIIEWSLIQTTIWLPAWYSNYHSVTGLPFKKPTLGYWTSTSPLFEWFHVLGIQIPTIVLTKTLIYLAYSHILQKGTCFSLGQSSLLTSSQTFLAWTLSSKTVPSFFFLLSSFSFFCLSLASIFVRGFLSSSSPSFFTLLPNLRPSFLALILSVSWDFLSLVGFWAL